MDLANLSRREKILILLGYIAVLILCVTILYDYMLSPSLKEYLDMVKRYNSQQEQNKRAIAQREALIRRYVSLKSIYDETNRYLFTKIQAEDWLETLPVLSKKTGTILTSIRPKESKSLAADNPSKGKRNVDKVNPSNKDELSEEEKRRLAILAGISEMPITIGIGGRYSNIIKLFDTLEGFKQLMVISEFSVAKSSKDNNQVETRFQLNLIHTNSKEQTLPIESFPGAVQLAELYSAESKEISAEGGETVVLANSASDSSAGESRKKNPTGRSNTRSNSTKSGSKVTKPDTGKSESDSRTMIVPGSGSSIYSIQIGSFRDEANSRKSLNSMKSKGHPAWIYNLNGADPRKLVLVGKFNSMKEAEDYGKKMRNDLLGNELVIIRVPD